MKVVILAGGLGTRISEESHLRPKPMLEIGGKPILWHIMKSYSAHGLTDFIILCGYKGHMIKEYFTNYLLYNADVSVDLGTGDFNILNHSAEPWRITMLSTGELTQTGGRLAYARPHLSETFCLTYGDGVSDVDLTRLIEFHHSEGRQATVTAVQPSGRFGSIEIEGNGASGFVEKPAGDNHWVSGGFFVCEPPVLDHIEGPDTIWEKKPMQQLAEDGQLSVYKHRGFWSAMDTLRDKNQLEALWSGGGAPWKTWG
ncbi:alpha-D-glucose-1-phosphate cytidylyltransferase [Roseobacter sp. SK209-2-6]|uniref:glucose-1-phosphate cytidylyltransferase n=2 Tax=Roseobacter sp. SK209-2-6 TaxID=388739 RepID=UPI0000F3F22C|nr:glucose-1-phosphate cytidylyltransferase [Roseobacter sp. SK209-2-6]EBA14520.1 alpha-D-glucose-1-phosphate cytidylyltransferase [Roseobacter sp. SK209-2-6]